MKRLIAVSAAVVAPAVPATATAATSTGMDTAAPTARGMGSPNLKIKFDIFTTPGGKPVKIENFKFKRLIASCTSGEPQKVSGTIGRMKINDNKKFDGKVKKGGGKVVVEGVAKDEGKKVKGTIRAKGRFSPSTGCDSGKVPWLAERTR